MSNKPGNSSSGERKTIGTATVKSPTTPMTRSERLRKAAQRRRARLRFWTRLFSWSLFGCFIIAIGFAARTLMGIATGKNTNSFANMKNGIDSMLYPKRQFPNKQRLNVLLVGKDYEYVFSKDPTKNGMRHTKSSRADTIMLLSLDLEKQTVAAISIPRDTKVTAADGITGKINATFRAESHPKGGIQLLKDTVSELTGVPIDYHIILKPDAVKEVVDSVGGVEVETLDAMHYDDNWGQLHIHLPKGKQRIKGEEAIGFTRYREPNYAHLDVATGVKTPIPPSEVQHSKEEGDFRRQSRQQQLIRAVATAAKQPANWTRIDTIVNTAFAQLDTNLTNTQVMALGALFKSTDPNSMLTATLPGKGTEHGTYYYMPNADSIRATVDWLVHGDETASYRLTRVSVQNASQVPGVGRRVVEILKDRGFQVDDPETLDNPTPVATSKIVYNKQAVRLRAEKIATLVGADLSLLVKDTSPDTTGVMRREAGEHTPADVTLVIGQDIAQHLALRSASR
jgi:polyisoprenyl-teichoic acid--peptidoglycan teichoic acid transferase